MTEQDQFIDLVKREIPGISLAEIARRINVSRSAVTNRRFSAESAVKAWNEGGNPELRYVPARVELA